MSMQVGGWGWGEGKKGAALHGHSGAQDDRGSTAGTSPFAEAREYRHWSTAHGHVMVLA